MWQEILAAVSPFAFSSATRSFCPLYGAVFPPPTNLAASNTLQNALAEIRSVYDAGFAKGSSSYGPLNPEAAYAVQLFSLDSKEPLLEYYHRGTSLSNSSGVKEVDGDSVFRIGSISKLVTVYMVFAEIGDGHWNVPVTDVIPELQNRRQWEDDETEYLKWEDVTLGALAGQVAGVPRDLLHAPWDVLESHVEKLGLPSLEPEEKPACRIELGEPMSCDREAFFKTLDTRPPTYRPDTTPVYSNTAFMLLAYALEDISGKSFDVILKTKLVDPLGLTHTSKIAPDEAKGVIPFNKTQSWWDLDLGEGAPMGSLYSSLNDLSNIGRSILNSTLLDARTTRAWLKPTSFTSSINAAIGRPWEIHRAADVVPNRGVIDIFTKAGDIGTYHTSLGIIPDYNIGYVTAMAGLGPSYHWLRAALVDLLLPAVEEVAREQADAAYAGTYTATNGLNSSVTFVTDVGLPGLGIERWISNGSDFLKAYSLLQDFPITKDNLRVLPTNLEQRTGKGKNVAWHAVFESPPAQTHAGPFSTCQTWFSVDGAPYGQHSIDQVVFTLDATGKATSVSPKAFKIELERQ
ncbi:beta-lactamase/transpeptidase-like protein [Lophiostoma macrostomum CBS 122681]|uniref:Beta-lactamase/transpeptidase-like protein n=1 Tax=Lophiostoma macrostomum CBS 122681 TaxID=1314788 RepID=A0A6A6T498_9PLEO|nr:beta-lactamase/transpeptidase-like protein [Lophiostoma macrostomum CBS 122681]